KPEQGRARSNSSQRKSKGLRFAGGRSGARIPRKVLSISAQRASSECKFFRIPRRVRESKANASRRRHHGHWGSLGQIPANHRLLPLREVGRENPPEESAPWPFPGSSTPAFRYLPPNRRHRMRRRVRDTARSFH